MLEIFKENYKTDFCHSKPTKRRCIWEANDKVLLT